MNAKLKTKKACEPVNTAVQQVRIDQICSISRDILAREGYKKLTMRKVAAEAGIAVGHLQYFFPTKGILLRDMFEFVSDEYIAQYNDILDKLSSDRPGEMLGVIIEYLLNVSSDNNSNAFDIEFWALSLRNADVKTELDKLNAHHRKIFVKYISQVNPKIDRESCDLRSIQMAAIIDGLKIHTAHMKPKTKKYKHLMTAAYENIMRTAMD